MTNKEMNKDLNDLVDKFRHKFAKVMQDAEGFSSKDLCAMALAHFQLASASVIALCHNSENEKDFNQEEFVRAWKDQFAIILDDARAKCTRIDFKGLNLKLEDIPNIMKEFNDFMDAKYGKKAEPES